MTDLPKLEDFPFHDYDKLRFSDMDTLGHINNEVFPTLFSTGRTGLLGQEPINAWVDEQVSFVIARLELDYIAELLWPGIVHIGTAIKAVGRSSITLTQALYQEQKCAATAQTVMVQVDRRTHRPVPVSEASRAALAKFMLQTSA
jgi:acyl-CoA thioester hydrolase